MSAQHLPLLKLHRRSDTRPLNEETVVGLVGSIKEVGIINPLRVRPMGDAWEISAGSHRFEAAARLGLETVPCVVYADDDLHAELVMIDENLMRAELLPSDRARQTIRRKAIYEELHPGTKAGVAGAEARWNADAKLASASFADATAAATGKSTRVVQRDAERGEKVIDEVLDLIRGTPLDTGTYLDRIKRLPPNEQFTAAKRDLTVAREQRKPVKPSDPPRNEFELINAEHRALVRAWENARPEARERFMGDCGLVLDGEPVMDRRYA